MVVSVLFDVALSVFFVFKCVRKRCVKLSLYPIFQDNVIINLTFERIVLLR